MSSMTPDMTGKGSGAGFPGPAKPPTRTTGRLLVLVEPKKAEMALSLLKSSAGLAARPLKASRNPDAAIDPEEAAASPVVFFDRLNVAVVTCNSKQAAIVRQLAHKTGVMQSQVGAIRAVEDELFNESIYCYPPPNYPYCNAGFRWLGAPPDALFEVQAAELADEMASGRAAPRSMAAELINPFENTAKETWGLQALQVGQSQSDGSGIRVAILDTGLDPDHPAFGRQNTKPWHSFLPRQAVKDGHGHGTLLAGTVCGASQKGKRQYGVAPGAKLFVGKVLNSSLQ